LNSIAIIARYELARLFLTRRGLLSLTAFALVWALVLRYAIYGAAQFFTVDAPGGKSAVLVDSRASRILGSVFVLAPHFLCTTNR